MLIFYVPKLQDLQKDSVWKVDSDIEGKYEEGLIQEAINIRKFRVYVWKRKSWLTYLEIALRYKNDKLESYRNSKYNPKLDSGLIFVGLNNKSKIIEK